MHKHDKHHMQSNSDMIWPISYSSFDLHLGAPWSSCHRHDTMISIIMIFIIVSPWSCHVIKHRKIEPKAKHFSHCNKNQSSWQNQIDTLKRLAKISNHAYKNSEEIQIIFIDKLIINPQFIGSRQTHRKKSITSSRSPRTSRRTWYWESKRENKPSSY